MADVLTTAELQAMESALAAYRGYMARTRAAADETSPFSFGELFGGSYSRAWEIVRSQEDNLHRFLARRNEIIEAADHEAALGFAEQLRRIAGSPLPDLISRERESNSGTAVVGGALADTARDAGSFFRVGVPLVVVAVLAVALLKR